MSANLASKKTSEQSHVEDTSEMHSKKELTEVVDQEARELMEAIKDDVPKDDELSLDNIRLQLFEAAKETKISPAYKKKLASIRITEPIALAVANPEDLMNYMGVARDVADNMIQAAQKLLAEHKVIDEGPLRGSEILERRKKVRFLTTSSKALDELLKGGIETRAITEVYAEFGSGKSQMAFTLAVNCQLPLDKGGLDGCCLWIDTEGTFRPERIKDIAIAKGMDVTATLDGIVIHRMANAAHLELAVKDLAPTIRQYNIKLLVIDSLIALHRAEFAGRGNLYDKQHKLNILLNRLLKLAEFFNIAVLVTNQVSTSPESFFGDPTKATGGNVVAHGTTYRLSLRKAKDNQRVVRIVDSPYHAYTDCRIRIGREGVTDFKEDE